MGRNPTPAAAPVDPFAQGDRYLAGKFEIACGFLDPLEFILVPAGNLGSLRAGKLNEIVKACR